MDYSAQWTDQEKGQKVKQLTPQMSMDVDAEEEEAERKAAEVLAKMKQSELEIRLAAEREEEWLREKNLTKLRDSRTYVDEYDEEEMTCNVSEMMKRTKRQELAVRRATEEEEKWFLEKKLHGKKLTADRIEDSDSKWQDLAEANRLRLSQVKQFNATVTNEFDLMASESQLRKLQQQRQQDDQLREILRLQDEHLKLKDQERQKRLAEKNRQIIDRIMSVDTTVIRDNSEREREEKQHQERSNQEWTVVHQKKSLELLQQQNQRKNIENEFTQKEAEILAAETARRQKKDKSMKLEERIKTEQILSQIQQRYINKEESKKKVDLYADSVTAAEKADAKSNLLREVDRQYKTQIADAEANFSARHAAIIDSKTEKQKAKLQSEKEFEEKAIARQMQELERRKHNEEDFRQQNEAEQQEMQSRELTRLKLKEEKERAYLDKQSDLSSVNQREKVTKGWNLIRQKTLEQDSEKWSALHELKYQKSASSYEQYKDITEQIHNSVTLKAIQREMEQESKARQNIETLKHEEDFLLEKELARQREAENRQMVLQKQLVAEEEALREKIEKRRQSQHNKTEQYMQTLMNVQKREEIIVTIEEVERKTSSHNKPQCCTIL